MRSPGHAGSAAVERSAIGTHGFARGGLLVEGGKRAVDAVSPLVSRIELPDAWRFILLIDRSRHGLSGPQERSAFAELPQVPAEATARLCREVLVELLPAAAEGDFEAFAESVYRYGHESGLLFSQRQGGPFAAGLPTELIGWLRGQGIRGVGQSSWGPTVFALARDTADAARVAADAQRRFRRRQTDGHRRRAGESGRDDRNALSRARRPLRLRAASFFTASANGRQRMLRRPALVAYDEMPKGREASTSGRIEIFLPVVSASTIFSLSIQASILPSVTRMRIAYQRLF